MLTPETFERVRALVLARAGLDLGPDKAYLVDARLDPLARARGGSLDDLVLAAVRDPDGRLGRDVVEAMLTCETSFFRDPPAFDQLRQHVLPALLRGAPRELSIWCAACSSGQEPYSVAMVVLEHFAPLLAAGWRVRIIATDLSDERLERTRRGVYSQHEVNRGLPASYLVRYFVRRGMDWEVVPAARRLVEVRRLNLATDPAPASPLDVILLRNVLIYFGTELKRAVLGRAQAALQAEGFLFLGGAETTLGLHGGFEPLGPARAGWYRPRATEVRHAVPRG